VENIPANDLLACLNAVILFPTSPSPSSESGSLLMVLLSAGVIALAAISMSFATAPLDGAVASGDKEEGRLLYGFHLVRPLNCSRNSV
jgi:hypothetical protein